MIDFLAAQNPGELQAGGEGGLVGPVTRGGRAVPAALAPGNDLPEDGEEKEAEPHALAAPLVADAVVAVVPVAAPHQRESVRTGRRRPVDRAETVLEEMQSSANFALSNCLRLSFALSLPSCC